MMIISVSCGDFVSNPDQPEVSLPAQEELIALIRGVDDAASRVAPALADASGRASLVAALDKLRARLNARDGPGADRALADVRAAMVVYRASSGAQPEDAPELSSIDISLDRVDGQLQRLCARTASAAGTASAARTANANLPGFAARVTAGQTRACTD